MTGARARTGWASLVLGNTAATSACRRDSARYRTGPVSLGARSLRAFCLLEFGKCVSHVRAFPKGKRRAFSARTFQIPGTQSGQASDLVTFHCDHEHGFNGLDSAVQRQLHPSRPNRLHHHCATTGLAA